MSCACSKARVKKTASYTPLTDGRSGDATSLLINRSAEWLCDEKEHCECWGAYDKEDREAIEYIMTSKKAGTDPDQSALTVDTLEYNGRAEAEGDLLRRTTEKSAAITRVTKANATIG